ncbi:hypothetical protein K0504_09670 [Neiella marina]|uniref:Uncharacterized protein n=1 Tax=Neiella holothuriorum TaxID=2870530 RepID=A0ABS7EG39_9GAMM|nr:hypothetical protein [Neiella holothuriorum]MBW8191304.1 hypothetical protein [Neiella holothuriorum]
MSQDALNNLSASLGELADAIEAKAGNHVSQASVLGAHFSRVPFSSVAAMCRELSSDLVASYSGSTATVEDLESYDGIVAELKQHVVPHLVSNNAQGHQALPNLLTTLTWLKGELSGELISSVMNDENHWPPSLEQRVRKIAPVVSKLEDQTSGLSGKVTAINEAYKTSRKLPETLASLEQAASETEDISTQLNRWKKSSGESRDKTIKHEQDAQKALENAAAIEKRIEEKYRIVTSTGLAAAFNKRALMLSLSLWGWFAILVTSITVAIWIGHGKLVAVEAMLTKETIHYAPVFIQLFLAALGLGGPIWIAIIATSQIGQRFKLSEDYAYKATVSQAYEGYRQEAVNLDEEYAKRLFSTALTRVEEAPLRLIQHESTDAPPVQVSKRVVATLEKTVDKLADVAKPIARKLTAKDETAN